MRFARTTGTEAIPTGVARQEECVSDADWPSSTRYGMDLLSVRLMLGKLEQRKRGGF